MTLTFGFSPCPNDTFMFEAIVNRRIDLHRLDIKVVMADVEELNLMAIAGQLDITKLSYNAFAELTDTYQLLDAGSALGHNCGPLLVKKAGKKFDDISTTSIAIPGKNTTANLLLSYAYPSAVWRREYLFSEIEEAVLEEEVDLGLLIHENRFTYHERGLDKVTDLGQHWENETGSPIPLGGIVVRRNLPEAVKEAVQETVRESVLFASHNRTVPLPYIREHAQEMDEAVMYSHIDLYVNEYSIRLGDRGRAAVEALLHHKGTAFSSMEHLFV